MTLTLAAPAPSAAPRSSASRCYGQATILMRRGGGLTTADAALVTAYLPGTSTPYPDALYGGPDATAPLAFPVATGGDGVVALWADAPGRLELEAVHPVLGRARGVLDLEPDPDAAPEPVDAYTKTESDARYLQAPLTAGQIPAEFLTQTEGDARYAALGAPGAVASVNGQTGVVVLAAADVGALTQAAADARYEPLDSAYTKGESDARYVPAALPDAKGDLLAASGPDALARLPLGTSGQVLTADSAQTLGVKWATPAAPGITSGYWQAGAGTTPKLTVQSSAPSSPATGDLWDW